jgi:ribosomal protein S18 acetylase RimI-like enzyme
MRIGAPETDEVDDVVDLWLDLARGQRGYGSHIYADANRQAVREAVARSVVADGIRVAHDPEVVGFVMYDLEVGRFEQAVTRGVVHNIYVAPDSRGEGIGTALLAAAEAALADAGADVVALEAMADNEDAVRFYERHGYRPHRVELEKATGETESDTHSKMD